MPRSSFSRTVPRSTWLEEACYARNVRRPLPILLLLAATACGATANLARVQIPLPAGRLPSDVSKMVCSMKVQDEIANVLGVKPVEVTAPTWVNHVYSCRFMYSNGVMVLSVKELSSAAETSGYFHSLANQLGNAGHINGLGQGAFSVKNGSVVVRKDYKVLLVDISELPGQFGSPPTSSADVANTVADVVLGCWAGD